MSVTIGRVTWPGIVGIGAGLVKNGASLLDLSSKASSIEVGSITRHLREGNTGQVIWKFPHERGMRHNAGMPNLGAEHAVVELTKVQANVSVPWGVNIATSPGIADQERAVADITETATILLQGGVKPTWLTLNVSSPDTEDDVRMLQNPQRVQALLQALKPICQSVGNIPLWLKVSPDLTRVEIAALAPVVLAQGVEAIICGNTLPDSAGNPGGWSGEPVRAIARASVWEWRQASAQALPIIATGGVLEGEHALGKLEVGAAAIQVVTALLMRGRDAARIIETEYANLVQRNSPSHSAT